MRIIQIRNSTCRRVALVDEPRLRLLDGATSIYSLAANAIANGISLSEAVKKRLTQKTLDYDSVYENRTEWRILPAIDHPEEPARCMVSGTGLTHLGSARDRQSMHECEVIDKGIRDLTDSMKMFRLGLNGGRPPEGCIGTAPEWFYKGTGVILRGHNEAVEVPCYAEDGGEEAEIAGVYLVDAHRRPWRLGMTIGNEFSDHRFEKRNYLNLAGSKLHHSAIGPELVIGAEFASVPGEVTIQRGDRILWSRQIHTGEMEMCHSLQNIEHHHFKFQQHRRPGDIHVHFFGTDCLSFGDGIQLTDGDVMQIRFEGFGRPLRNAIRLNKEAPELISTVPLA